VYFIAAAANSDGFDYVLNPAAKKIENTGVLLLTGHIFRNVHAGILGQPQYVVPAESDFHFGFAFSADKIADINRFA
jgi:hypothetical protein